MYAFCEIIKVASNVNSESVGDSGKSAVASGNAGVGTVFLDGVTRDVNVVPIGEMDVDTEPSFLVGKTGEVKGIPKNLFDWQFLTSFTLSNPAIGGTIAPYSIFNAIPYVASVLRGRAFRNFCLELKFVAQPTAYHYGLVCFSWHPGFEQKSAPTKIQSLISFGTGRSRKYNVTIDLANPEVQVMRVPLAGPYGTLRSCTAPFPLETDDKVIYNCLNNAAYRMDGDYTPVVFEVQARIVPGGEVYGLSTSSYVSLTRFTSKEKPSSGAPLKKESPHLDVSSVSKALGFAADVFGALSSVPVLTGFFSAPAAFTRHGAAMAKIAGYSAPTDPQPVPELSQAVTGSRTNFDVPNTTRQMAHSAMNGRLIGAPFSDKEPDECSFGVLADRWGEVALYTMDATEIVGDPLINRSETQWVFVDPCWVDNYNPMTDIIQLSGPAFVALPHNYWGGSLTYRFTVVASKYHSGRLRLVYDPNVFSNWNSLTNLTRAQQVYTEVFDVGEGVVVEFTVPWTNLRPWANCRSRISDDVPSSGGLYDTTDAENLKDRANINGGLALYVESPLISVAPSTKPINILVEVKGGPDFRVAELSASSVYVGYVSAKVGTSSVGQIRPLGKGTVYSESELAYFGEVNHSARAACKEMMCIGRFALPPEESASEVGGFTRWFGPVYPHVARAQSDPVNPIWTPFNWFRRGFCCVSGGMRYKISRGLLLTADDTVIATKPLLAVGSHFRARDYSPAGYPDGFTSYLDMSGVRPAFARAVDASNAVNVQDLSRGALEFTVPMMFPSAGAYGFVDSPDGQNGDNGMMYVPYEVTVCGELQNALGDAMPVVWAGSADDFNMSYYDGPPMIAGVGG